MPPLERALVRQILVYLRSLPNAEFRKRPPVYVTGHKGDPDIFGSLGSRHVELEVKRPGEKLTKLQAAMLERWKAAGAIAGVVHSVEEAKQLLASNWSVTGKS